MEQMFLNELSCCSLCPRNCGVNRLAGELGFCKSGAGFEVASIVAHHGEEPVISGEKGICNVFFAHCNLDCVFCQNHQISKRSKVEQAKELTLAEVLLQITQLLDQGINHVGFVSPSHFIPQTKAIIHALRQSGRNPVFVYNTNAYDSVDALKGLESYIDVYLPDIKYMNEELGKAISAAPNYPNTASKALKEMYRQKGARLELNDDGLAQSGIIIRHLVLPGQVENSLQVLEFIAFEVSYKMHISLMAQYKPTQKVMAHHFLNRAITEPEYEQVLDKLEELNLYNGWVQDLSSADNYNPDFEQQQPFK